MKTVSLGSTDLQVSRLGLGTVKFGRNQGVNYPKSFTLPSDHAISELLNCAQELGINLLDTAPAYGVSEERLGKLLKHQRDKWILSTKVGEEFSAGQSHFDFSPDAIRRSVERSLKRLNTDILDIVLVHSNGEDEKIILEDEVFVTLGEMKQAGVIKSFGMSTKTVKGGFLTVDHSDIVMVTFNLNHSEEQPVIAYAYKQNKGVLIKKGLISGHLDKIAEADPVQASMRFIFQEPGVHSLIVGTLNKEHLKKNVDCLDTSLRGA